MQRFVAALVILAVMLALALLLFQGEPSVAEIDRLAKAKDAESLSRLVAVPPGSQNPFAGLKTNGAYDTGRFGWTAQELPSPDGKDRYVVIGTKITSEDVGEILLKREGNGLRYVPEQEDMGIKIHRHKFDLSFVPAEKRAVLRDQMDFSSAAGKTGAFVFRMSPNYKVSAIMSDGKTIPFRQASGIVAVERPAGRATYDIRYEAVVDLRGYAGSVSTSEATLVNDYWYPMIARQPAPYDITLTVPEGWTGIAQGELVSKTANTSTYKMDLPVVYYSVSAGPYKTVEQKVGGRTVWAASPRLAEEELRIQNELYAPIVDFYEKSFGKYPFSKWGALDSPAYGGGALEAYSYATWGGGMPMEDAHEPAHTWWGGILNNTYLESFWNESFAVFSDGLYNRNVPIGNVAERRLAFVSDASPSGSYDRVSLVDGGAFAGPVASGLGYGKGGKVLQMLEQYLGTEKMIATMREWVKVDAGKAVDWADYERVVLRMAPDKDLKSFFDDWLRKPGSVDLRVTDVALSGSKLSFNVGFNGQALRVPLEVMTQDAAGNRHFALVDVRRAGPYSINVQGKPTLASFDPWNRLLRKRAADEMPASFQRSLGSLKVYRDPARAGYFSRIRSSLQALPTGSLAGTFIIGHPDSTPRMKELCALAGFQVVGDKLTYKGTTIDLNRGAAVAIVDVPGGKAGVALGKTTLFPNIGRARIALVDDLGRFLRGVTEPKTNGALTFKL